MGNKSYDEIIAESHKERESFLQAIKNGDPIRINYFKNIMVVEIKGDLLNIMSRVPGNKLRSYKNFLLSHNTLYSYSAEKGGLSAAQSHFMSEKYAIMIEHTNQIEELDQIHLNMIDAYMDTSIRIKYKSTLTLYEKTLNFIEMNFSEHFTIDDIAKKLHVHSSHLMRVFKKESGTTISHYRNQRRIKEAKELLAHTNMSMTEIAVMIGFNNSQYFSKIFKQEAKITPKAFKQNMSPGNKMQV